jgi:hypothetical protein
MPKLEERDNAPAARAYRANVGSAGMKLRRRL